MDRKATSNEPTHRRYVLYPIQEEALWDMYKTAESKFWTAEDFAFPTTDNAHDKRMDDLAVVISPLMTILSNMLMYRGSNTLSILASKTAHQEAKAFLSYQGMMRNIHAECYGNIIAYIAPNSLHGDVVSTIENRDAYAPCKTWVDSHKEARISVYAAVAACEETILFSSFQLIVGLAQALKIPNIAEIASKIRTDAELTTAFLIRLCARDADHSHLAEIRTTIQRALEFELSAIEATRSGVFKNTDAYDRARRQAQKLAEDLLQRFTKTLELRPTVHSKSNSHRRQNNPPRLISLDDTF